MPSGRLSSCPGHRTPLRYSYQRLRLLATGTNRRERGFVEELCGWLADTMGIHDRTQESCNNRYDFSDGMVGPNRTRSTSFNENWATGERPSRFSDDSDHLRPVVSFLGDLLCRVLLLTKSILTNLERIDTSRIHYRNRYGCSRRGLSCKSVLSFFRTSENCVADRRCPHFVMWHTLRNFHRNRCNGGQSPVSLLMGTKVSQLTPQAS